MYGIGVEMDIEHEPLDIMDKLMEIHNIKEMSKEECFRAGFEEGYSAGITDMDKNMEAYE